MEATKTDHNIQGAYLALIKNLKLRVKNFCTFKIEGKKREDDILLK